MARSGSVFRRRAAVETFNDGLLVLLLLALAWTPLYFGGHRLLSWAVNAVLFGLLLVVFEAGQLAFNAQRPVALRRIWWLGAGFALGLGWIALQTVSWTPSAWHSPFWALAQQALVALPQPFDVAGAISVTPDEGIVGLLRLGAAGAAFYLGLQLCRDRSRAEWFARGLVLIVAAYAAFGIAQWLLFPATGLWGPRTAYVETVTATFINRNTFATFAGIGLVLACGMLMEGTRAPTGRQLPYAYQIAESLDRLVRRGVPLLVPALIILIGLLGSQSRAGTLFSFLGVLAAILLFISLGKGRGLAVVAATVLVGGLGIGFLAYGEGVTQRIEGGAEDLDIRLDTFVNTFMAALDRPWTGFGYGSFQPIYPQYRTDEITRFYWNFAHNTYVELALEVGLPVTLLAIALVVALLAVMVRNVLGCERRPMLSLAALAASVTVLLHALVDFSLQIQSVALIYWTLMGAGLAQSWSRRIDCAR